MLKLSPALRNILGTHGQLPPRLINMPLFVIGNMRSGTTLLVNKLSQHPQLLKIGSELNEIWTEIGGAPCHDHCTFRDEKNTDYSYAFQMSNYFLQFVEDSKSIKRHAMRGLNRFQQQEGRVFYDWPNVIPVNKSPHLMNKVGYVHGLFPDSRFIFIIRDIYAQASSMKAHFDDYYRRTGKVYAIPDNDLDCWSRIEPNETNKSKGAYPPDFSAIPRMWIRLNVIALKSLQELPMDQFFCIDFNDFVSDQARLLSGIFDYLDLEEKHQAEATRITTLKSSYKNTQTSGDPVDKWKKYLTEEEIKSIDQVIIENQENYNWIQTTINNLKF